MGDEGWKRSGGRRWELRGGGGRRGTNGGTAVEED